MSRGQTELVTTVLLVSVTVAALAIAASIVVSDFLRVWQPRGELIEFYATAETENFVAARRIRVVLLVSCSGSNCDSYTVTNVEFHGILNASPYYLSFGSDNINKRLRSGTTRIESLIFVDPSLRIRELMLVIRLRRPDSTEETVYRSIPIR